MTPARTLVGLAAAALLALLSACAGPQPPTAPADIGELRPGMLKGYLRPFVVHKETTCAPQDEPRLVKDGSYPSGHSALGWGWALVLAELMPERTDALIQRGHAFGQSRVVCGVHWQSDVDAGRVMGAAAVARLHADPVFQAQMQAAASEIRALRASGRGTARQCAAEAEALKLR